MLMLLMLMLMMMCVWCNFLRRLLSKTRFESASSLTLIVLLMFWVVLMRIFLFVMFCVLLFCLNVKD